MSVGGRVIDVAVLPDKVWVDTQERMWYPPENRFRDGTTCAIYVQRNPDAEMIEPGDSLWWQGNEAYWTPQDHTFEDRPIPRIGYSGVPRP